MSSSRAASDASTPISTSRAIANKAIGAMSNSTRSSSSSLTLPDVTLDGNPGMTSGEDTPNSSYPDALPDGVHVLTPPPKNGPEIEILDADSGRAYPPELAAHDDAITKEDVAADPILHDLADSQGSQDSNFRYSGLGPRLSKAAALRMKLKWEDPRDVRRVSGEDVPVNFDNVPGHKRAGLELVSCACCSCTHSRCGAKDTLLIPECRVACRTLYGT